MSAIPLRGVAAPALLALHRVHHSAIHRERYANFGFDLSSGDRMFGVWVERPAGGHERMVIEDRSFDGAESFAST